MTPQRTRNTGEAERRRSGGREEGGARHARRHGGGLFDLYNTHRERAKSWTETRRIMEREVLPVWRHLRVQDLKRRDVRELVERKAQSAPIMANRILSRISAMLTFALEHDWIESNPASRIRKPGEERSGDRVLSRDEVRELWAALHETEARNADRTPRPRLSQTLNDMLIVMLAKPSICVEISPARVAPRARLATQPGHGGYELRCAGLTVQAQRST
jgi:integrase